MFGETNKSAEFLKKFPLGKVPAFEGSDGLILTESNAIAYYVANDELRGGSDTTARAQVCTSYVIHCQITHEAFLFSCLCSVANIVTSLRPNCLSIVMTCVAGDAVDVLG